MLDSKTNIAHERECLISNSITKSSLVSVGFNAIGLRFKIEAMLLKPHERKIFW